MLPARERLREIANGSDGSLAEVPYAVLLSAMALEKRSCLAVLTRPNAEKRIFFLDGVPVECLSNLLHETFGRFLVGQGKLTEEQFDLAFAQANASGLRLGEVLVERAVFPREEVARFLQQNLARKLLDGFTWHEGTYQLVPDPPAVADPPRMNVAQIIVAGVARFAPQHSVDSAIGKLIGKKLALHPAPPFPLPQIRLTEKQSRLTATLENRPRIDELAVSGILPYEEVSRLIYALWLLGTVVTADQVPAPRPSSASIPRVSPPPSCDVEQPARDSSPSIPRPAPCDIEPPVRASSPAIGTGDSGFRRPAVTVAKQPRGDREELKRAFDTMRGLDAFDLLGVADEATDDAIRGQFLVKARAWAPWQFEGDAADEERASDLFMQLAAAFGEIHNRTTRDALKRSRRITGQAVIRDSPSKFFAIKTDVVDPEKRHRKGVELLTAGRPKDALPLLAEASECDPQNGTWAAEAAYCKFLVNGKGAANATLAALENAIRIDDEAGLAFLYSGEVLRAKGDLALAEKFYKKAAKLMGSDKRPASALKELSRAGGR